MELNDYFRNPELFEFISDIDDKAKKISETYEKALFENRKNAIGNLEEFLELSSESCCEKGHEYLLSLAGGPSPESCAPLLNTIGIFYPFFKEDEKRIVASKIVNFLDLHNYSASQDIVETIHEPLLAADILLMQPMYWPGYGRYMNIIEREKECLDLEDFFKNACSEFFAAYSLTREETPKELREKFYKNYPKLLDRTLGAIAKISNYFAEKMKEKKGTDMDYNLTIVLQSAAFELHEKILEKIK